MMPDDNMNLQELIDRARAMQEQMEFLQHELATTTVTETAGDGLVTVTLTMQGELTELRIDPKAVDPDDVEGLEDLIRTAFRKASQTLQKIGEDKLQPVTGIFDGLTAPGRP
jgi:nucleoid-associated protein EbfC